MLMTSSLGENEVQHVKKINSPFIFHLDCLEMLQKEVLIFNFGDKITVLLTRKGFKYDASSCLAFSPNQIRCS